MDKLELTKKIKEVAKQHGATLVGVAPIERFDPMPPYYDKAPEGQHPKDFLPDAKSVISIAMPILNATLDAPARLNEMKLEMYPDVVKARWLDSFYDHVAHVVHDNLLLYCAQAIGQFLLGFGNDAMIFPVQGMHFRTLADGTGFHEILRGDTKYESSKNGYVTGPFSHRHAATRAGLGEFGYNNLVLTPQYGCRQRFNSIITDAELEPDPLITKPICLRDKCRLCFPACHMDALKLRDDKSYNDYRSVEKVDRDIIFIDTPAISRPVVCQARMENTDYFPVRGDCYRVCPIPRIPKHPTKKLKALYDNWEKK